VCVSHIIQLTPQEQSAEPNNIASAEALTVARRPKESSREKTLAAAGITRFFSLFYFEAFVHESIILSLSPSTCIAHTIATVLHEYCAIYDPPGPPVRMPYTIRYNIGTSNSNIV